MSQELAPHVADLPPGEVGRAAPPLVVPQSLEVVQVDPHEDGDLFGLWHGQVPAGCVGVHGVVGQTLLDTLAESL